MNETRLLALLERIAEALEESNRMTHEFNERMWATQQEHNANAQRIVAAQEASVYGRTVQKDRPA